MKSPLSIEVVRQSLVGILASHIGTRNLGIVNPWATAKETVNGWKDVRCLVVYVRASTERQWLTHPQVARMCGITAKSAAKAYRNLERVTVRLPNGSKAYLFRDGVEMHRRGRGTVGDEKFNEAVCLWLGCHDDAGRAGDMQKVEVSTAKFTRTAALNYQGAVDVLHGAGIVTDAEADAARETVQAVTGAKGPQLSLLTGTDGR